MMFVALAASCKVNAVEIIDPEEAKKDADFLVQGEYVGEGVKEGSGDKAKFGAQVIALSKGEFSIYLYEGGLPGDGWMPVKKEKTDKKEDGKKTDESTAKRRLEKSPELKGKTVEKEVQISSPIGVEGKIVGDTMTLKSSSAKFELKRVERKSPTLEAKAPAGAKVLFDGTTADNFEHGTMSTDKNLMADAASKEKFGDHHLHLEFRLSYMPEAREQGRSNSGVYVHDCYEMQVLDSFGLKGENNECGGFYSIREPDVNMCFPPLVWQTYDIDFTAPKYENDKKVSNARITVKHNGVTIHDNIELPHDTPGRDKEGPAPRPFYLQGHGNKVEYRNIWVEEKK
jgi:RNase P/RNase MRP subunit p29